MPARKVFTPRPYQARMVTHILTHPRCNIWAGMGMGKTVATLTALDTLFKSGSEMRPALVLAPLRVATSTWPDEALKWTHLRNLVVQPITGTPKQRLAALANSNANVFTTNYDNVLWLVETLRGRWPFGTVVADESTRLKSFRLNSRGKRAAALAKIAHKSVDRWVNLTGTPAPNGLIDLWGQAWFVDEGDALMKNFGSFESRWFRKLQFPGQPFSKLIPLEYAQEQIHEALAGFTLSLNPADWFDIDQPIHNTINVTLPPKARKQYEEMEQEMFLELEDIGIEAPNAAARTMKCLQLASGAVYTDDSGEWLNVHDEKLKALESIISESGSTPVLVAYHWKHDLERLLKTFPDGHHLDVNPQTISDWNAGRIPLLFAHPASAGHGLNLQDGGNVLVFFSHWWGLEQYQQIIERIGPTRQAQAVHPRPVFIHHIVATDTVDELVMERRDSKRQVQDILLEAMKRKKKRGLK